jgi:hypothetical protein
MKRCPQPISAFLLFSLAPAPLGEVFAVSTSTEAKVYTTHLDHLGGTRAVSEYDGDTIQGQHVAIQVPEPVRINDAVRKIEGRGEGRHE